MAYATRQLLADSLKKLVQKKPLEKITIKELVEDCGVNRQTFYYNFQDIYDLLAWIFKEDHQKLLEPILASDDVLNSLPLILNYLKENKRMILNIYHSLAHPVLEQYLKSEFILFISAVVDSYIENTTISSEDRAFVIKVYTLAAVGIVREWLDNDMDEAYELDFEKLIPLVRHSLQSNMERLSG